MLKQSHVRVHSTYTVKLSNTLTSEDFQRFYSDAKEGNLAVSALADVSMVESITIRETKTTILLPKWKVDAATQEKRRLAESFRDE